MGKREINAIHDASEALEIYVNTTVKEVLEQHDIDVAMNILLNVGTSMLAKALILIDPNGRNSLKDFASQLIDQKVDEGHAAIVSVMAINRAMLGSNGDGSTCSPRPPKH